MQATGNVANTQAGLLWIGYQVICPEVKLWYHEIDNPESYQFVRHLANYASLANNCISASQLMLLNYTSDMEKFSTV